MTHLFENWPNTHFNSIKKKYYSAHSQAAQQDHVAFNECRTFIFLGPFYLLVSHQPFTIHRVLSLKSSSHLPSSFYYVWLYQEIWILIYIYIYILVAIFLRLSLHIHFSLSRNGCIFLSHKPLPRALNYCLFGFILFLFFIA